MFYFVQISSRVKMNSHSFRHRVVYLMIVTILFLIPLLSSNDAFMHDLRESLDQEDLVSALWAKLFLDCFLGLGPFGPFCNKMKKKPKIRSFNN